MYMYVTINFTVKAYPHTHICQTDRSHGRATNDGAPPPHIMPTTSSSSSSSSQIDAHLLRHLGARKKFNLSEIAVGGVGGSVAGGTVAEGVTMGGASHMRISGSGSSISGGALVSSGVSTPIKEREQSSLVSLLHVAFQVYKYCESGNFCYKNVFIVDDGYES